MSEYIINKASFDTKYYEMDVAYIADDGTKRSYAGNTCPQTNLYFYKEKLVTLIRDYFGLNPKWNASLHSINYAQKNLKTSLLLENNEIYPRKTGYFNFAIEYGANPTVSECEIQKTYEDLRKELIKYIQDVDTARV